MSHHGVCHIIYLLLSFVLYLLVLVLIFSLNSNGNTPIFAFGVANACGWSTFCCYTLLREHCQSLRGRWVDTTNRVYGTKFYCNRSGETFHFFLWVKAIRQGDPAQQATSVFCTLSINCSTEIEFPLKRYIIELILRELHENHRTLLYQ